MRFARAAKDDPRLAKALESVAFVKIDRSEDANDGVVESFGFKGIPHFFLIRPDGTVLDRWLGFDDVDAWLSIFEPSLADGTSIDEKVARFERSPAGKDAAVLGRIRESQHETVDAVRYYSEAIRLDPALARKHAVDVFSNQAKALPAGDFSLDEVRASADAVFALDEPEPKHLVLVADSMSGIARERRDWTLAAPYLEPAIDASADAGGWVADARADLRVLQAMYVEDDKERGLALKRETLSEGWDRDPEELNAFAWWCFENGVNLPEAEALARKGAELAEEGTKRAMILDTVAEIRNAQGDPTGAAAWSERALAADPGNDYYAKQKARFVDAAKVGSD